MEKDVAEAIISAAVSLDAGLGELFDQIERVTEESTRRQLKQAAGNLMELITRDIIFPIVKVFPELDPDVSLVRE